MNASSNFHFISFWLGYVYIRAKDFSNRPSHFLRCEHSLFASRHWDWSTKKRKNLTDNLHLVNWFFSGRALFGLDLGDATVTLLTFLVSLKAQTIEMGVTMNTFVTTQDRYGLGLHSHGLNFEYLWLRSVNRPLFFGSPTALLVGVRLSINWLDNYINFTHL